MVRRIVEPCSERFRVEHGKKVWEILPRALEDKGAAVKREFASLRGRSIPVYLGDDQTDEPAFAVLRSGITVRVGRTGASHARYRLGGIADVRRFLYRLREEVA